jgi:hypothetical protein
MVVASSFRTSGVADLEVIFHENMDDLRTLLALEKELRRRKTPSARVLCGRVQQQLVSLQVSAARSEEARPWYRRGVFWLIGFVLAGITTGVLHGMGFHLWGPISRALQF